MGTTTEHGRQLKAMLRSSLKFSSKVSAAGHRSSGRRGLRCVATGYVVTPEGFRPPAKAADRPLWCPGGEPPSHLNGSLSGDYGFDPLSLGADKELLKWMVQAELQHGRWAMLGVVGAAIPDLINNAGIANLPMFYQAGKADFGMSFATLAVFQAVLMNWDEVRRWQDMREPGSMNQDPLFPQFSLGGGKDVGYPNPLKNACPTGEVLQDLKIKEVKHGRLAMLAFVGQCTVALSLGQGPIDALASHIASPGSTTMFQML